MDVDTGANQYQTATAADKYSKFAEQEPVGRLYLSEWMRLKSGISCRKKAPSENPVHIMCVVLWYAALVKRPGCAPSPLASLKECLTEKQCSVMHNIFWTLPVSEKTKGRLGLYDRAEGTKWTMTHFPSRLNRTFPSVKSQQEHQWNILNGVRPLSNLPARKKLHHFQLFAYLVFAHPLLVQLPQQVPRRPMESNRPAPYHIPTHTSLRCYSQNITANR